jgi:hypothetical protein
VESEADLDALAAASQIPDWVAARIAKRKAAEKLKAAERAAAAAAERARLGGRSSMHGGARSSMHGGGARSSMHGGDARSSMHVLPTESPSEPDEQATKPTYGRTHSEVFRLFKGMHFGLTHMFKELQFHGACVQALSELHVLTVQLVDLRVRAVCSVPSRATKERDRERPEPPTTRVCVFRRIPTRALRPFRPRVCVCRLHCASGLYASMGLTKWRAGGRRGCCLTRRRKWRGRS